jgi:uncharacterized protein DUF4136
MHRTTLGALASALILAGAAQAAAQDVTYDYDRTFDFTRVKTYAWVEGEPLKDELNHRRIVEAIEAQLAARGLTQAVDAAPDVTVTYFASFHRSLRIDGYGTGWGGYRWSGMRSGTARVGEVLGGALMVEISDARTTRILWRGMARKDVELEASPERHDRSIGKAVERLFKGYPVRVEK